MQEKIIPSKTEDIYARDFQKKAFDFCIGFFYPYIFAVIILIIFSSIYNMTGSGTDSSGIWLLLAFLVLLVVGLVFYLVKQYKNGTLLKRRYLLIGLISAIILPFIFLFACIIYFNSVL